MQRRRKVVLPESDAPRMRTRGGAEKGGGVGGVRCASGRQERGSQCMGRRRAVAYSGNGGYVAMMSRRSKTLKMLKML